MANNYTKEKARKIEKTVFFFVFAMPNNVIVFWKVLQSNWWRTSIPKGIPAKARRMPHADTKAARNRGEQIKFWTKNSTNNAKKFALFSFLFLSRSMCENATFKWWIYAWKMSIVFAYPFFSKMKKFHSKMIGFCFRRHTFWWSYAWSAVRAYTPQLIPMFWHKCLCLSCLGLGCCYAPLRYTAAGGAHIVTHSNGFIDRFSVSHAYTHKGIVFHLSFYRLLGILSAFGGIHLGVRFVETPSDVMTHHAYWRLHFCVNTSQEHVNIVRFEQSYLRSTINSYS